MKTSTPRLPQVTVALLGVGALGMCALAMRLGASHISWSNALNDAESIDRAIVQARAARVFLGAITGGALALVGAAFQALLRNPLGDPFALGVSGGGALGATIAVLLGVTGVGVPIAAFLGAMGATTTVLATARAVGKIDAQGLLLAGLVFNACANALLALLRSLVRTSKAQEILTVLLGAIAEENGFTVLMVAAFVAVGSVILWVLSKPMDLLTLGQDTAMSLGIAVRRVEIVVFIASSLVVGAVVSLCGLIPFIGLIVPHYARAWVGPNHRVLLPACFFGGAMLLVVADTITRLMFLWFGTEPPVGALTAIVGGPFFFISLKKQR